VNAPVNVAVPQKLPTKVRPPESRSKIQDLIGWMLYATVLLCIAILLPADAFDPASANYFMAIGALGVWRYSLRAIHFVRAMIFLHWEYPRLRKIADASGNALAPSHVYLLITSFRIDAQTTADVYRASIEEAIRCGWPATLVASIVEMSDQRIILSLWETMRPPAHVRLKIVRIPGTGKRDGLAQGFRAISRDMPDNDAVVAVIDGDTLLEPGVVSRTAPYLKLMPHVGALTTNEFCKVEGGYLVSEWYKLRFAQRHLNMCSMALTRRVLTLTGRMSVFRASIITDPSFIYDVQHDALDHWRLGRFNFLTGDDKSSWYSLMRLGWDTWYVPDAAISTVEHPPDPSFFKSCKQLMFRWYGNSLRQNGRAMGLGPGRLGWFTYYVLLDQRILMWTGLLGLALAIAASIRFNIFFLVSFLLWVGLTRLIMTFLLIISGHPIGPGFPLLLYYNQILGSLMKIKVSFRLDQQSWTRQKTTLDRGLNTFQARFNRWSSNIFTFAACSLFAAFVVAMVTAPT
jgi:glycosyltransferase Alg8